MSISPVWWGRRRCGRPGPDTRVAQLAALQALSLMRLCSMTVDRAIDVIYMVRNEQ